MMRIMLATGEEAVYRTVEELALGISSGTITGDARFFDFPSQVWRAIDAHPEYHLALARAATMAPGPLEPYPIASVVAPPIPVRKSDHSSGAFHIYQMFSLSAAELQAKKRPTWLLPGLATAAGLALLVSLMLVRGGRGGSTGGEETAALSVSSIAASSTRLPARASVEAMRLAPMNLNSHLRFAIDAAGSRLSDSVQAMGASRLMSRGRQLSADSVRLTRDALVAIRSLVARYRTTQRNTQSAYGDTATMLAKSGFWSKIDQQEWKLYPMAAESPQEAAQADSLLDQLEAFYDLLEDQPLGYREVGGEIQFDDPARSQQYKRLRTLLDRYQVEEDAKLARLTPLLVLRRAVNPKGIPSRAARSSR